MNGIVDWLISYSVKASLLCLATLLLLAALRGMSASVRSGILVAGVVGALVLPLTVGILPPISLSKIFPEPASKRVSLEGVLTLDGVDARSLLGHEVEDAVLANAGVGGLPSNDAAAVWPWKLIAGGVWLLGGIFSLAMLGFRILSSLRLRRSAVLVDPLHVLVMESRAAGEVLGLRRVVELRISETVSVPFSCGIGRDTIVLPAGFEQLPAIARRAVLLHECAHLRRRDVVAQIVISLCRSIHWFNPLFLILDRAFNAEAEKACDDRVIAHGIKARDYSETILFYFQAAAESPGGMIWNGAASGFYPCPQLDGRMRGRKRVILSRIRRMVDPAARRTVLSAVLGWVLIGAATGSASVLGALVFVPDYEWRYQLAERHLPYERDLVANWRLDIVAGEWTPDSRPQSRDGHVVGATAESDGRLDGAINLDGVNDYVDMGERFHDLEYPITLTAWVRSTGNRESSIQNVVWLGGGKSNEYIYIGMKYGHATIESRSGQSFTARSMGKITDGAWHHLAGVFVSESERRLYSDGELVAEDRQFSAKPPTMNLQIGRNGRKSLETNYTHGSIDDVRVYKAALDQAAVREIMKGDFAIIAARESVGAE